MEVDRAKFTAYVAEICADLDAHPATPRFFTEAVWIDALNSEHTARFIDEANGGACFGKYFLSFSALSFVVTRVQPVAPRGETPVQCLDHVLDEFVRRVLAAGVAGSGFAIVLAQAQWSHTLAHRVTHQDLHESGTRIAADLLGGRFMCADASAFFDGTVSVEFTKT
jgi:hypothetical protein